jgi:hypothetical protein
VLAPQATVGVRTAKFRPPRLPRALLALANEAAVAEGDGPTQRTSWGPRRQIRASSYSPPVPLACHEQRSRAVSSGQSRSLRDGRCAGGGPLTWTVGTARNCMACKRSKDRWGLRLDRNLVHLIGGTRTAHWSARSARSCPQSGATGPPRRPIRPAGGPCCGEGRPPVRSSAARAGPGSGSPPPGPGRLVAGPCRPAAGCRWGL